MHCRPPTEQFLPGTLSGTRTAVVRQLWKDPRALVRAWAPKEKGSVVMLKLSGTSDRAGRPQSPDPCRCAYASE